MKPPHLLKRLAIRVGIFGHKSTCMCILKKTYTNTNILILIIFGFNDRFEKEQLVPLYNNTLTVHIHTVPAFVYHCYVSRPTIKQGCKQKLCRSFSYQKNKHAVIFVITLKNYRQVYCYSSMRRRGNSNGHVPWARFWSTERVLSTFMRGSASDNCPSLSL